MVMGTPVQQCILQSGTLFLSPPQPKAVAGALIRQVGAALKQLGNWTLRDAPVSKILEAQADLGITSLYLQIEEALEGWQTKLGPAKRLLVGDTEYEVCFAKSPKAHKVAGCDMAELKKKKKLTFYSRLA
jgi:hypothetical protein